VRAVAFDLDGTLIDSRHDLASAVNLARSDLGFEPLAIDSIVAMIGEGARNLVRKALGGAPEPDLLEAALARFLVHYDTECTRCTRAFPGIDAMLSGLERLAPHVRLAIVTNKPEAFSRKIVDALGWRGRFDPLVGGDTLGVRKPDPAGLREVARRHDLTPDEILFVGDSGIDAATAAAAGARFVFVEWGFAREEERRELAGHSHVRDPHEILDFLD